MRREPTLSLLLPILLALTLAPSSAAVRHVNLANPSPAPPYDTWASAAPNIQDAIDAANAGDEIVVTNGVYASGGRTASGSLLTNRVVVAKPLTVRSVNGPEVTEIRGYQIPEVLYGNEAIRCVYLTNGARLLGFTLTSGSTRAYDGGFFFEEYFSGGGVWCASSDAVVSKCVLIRNSADSWGGGAMESVLSNCLLRGNSARRDGGGVFLGSLVNCTVIQNSAGARGGGVSDLRVNQGESIALKASNCIIYWNEGGDYSLASFGAPGILSFCWTSPQLDPEFVDAASGDFRLRSNSPCINSGINTLAPPGSDLDGQSRIAGGAVDIGAYEFQSPQSLISYAWLQLFGLPQDGTADNLDLDGDGLKNWQEWRAGTDPTNAVSTLRLLTPERSGRDLIVRWASVSGKTYSLERTTDLTSGTTFTPLAQNIPSQGDATMYTDPNVATDGQRYFYRVGVE